MRSMRLPIILVMLFLLAGCTSPEEKAQEFLAKGEQLLSEGEPGKARLEFRNALQLDENLSRGWFGLARIAEGEQKWQEMFQLLTRVVELEPENLEAQLIRGRLLLAGGQLDRALEVSSLTFEMAPEADDVLALRAAVFFKLEDHAQAIALANEALAQNPQNVDALVVLATERLEEGEPKAAIAYLDRAIGIDEGNAGLQLIRIEALNRLDDSEGAEEAFLALVDLYPESVALRHRLARFYLERFREEEAEQVYRDIAAANPESLEARIDVVRFVNSVRGNAAAIAEVEQFLAEHPEDVDTRFVLAQLQEAGGDTSASEATLRAIADDATLAEVRHRAQGTLATALLRRGENDAAMQLVDAILAEDPRNQQAVILKASQRIDARELDLAISDLRSLLKDNPQAPRVLLLLGQAHERQGARELADDFYARAFEASGQMPQYAMPYTRLLLAGRRIDRAAQVLEEALRRDPQHLPALTQLARIALGRGDWATAQSLADRIAALDDPEQVGQQIRGAVLAGRQDYDQSISVLREAVDAAASPDRPMASLVRTYVRAGKANEAHEFLNAVLGASPNNVSARLLQGQLFATQGDVESARSALEAVIEAAPSRILAYQNLAALAVRENDMEGAMSALERGLAANPEDFTLRLGQASMLEQEGDYDGAIAAYEALLAERPNADVVANNLASLLSDHRSDEASLRRALQLAGRFRGSDVPYFKDTLGWTFYRMGNSDSARDLIEDAAKEVPQLPIFRYHLGMTYLAEEDREGAKRELQEALRLTPESDLVLRADIEAAIESL